MKDNDQLSPQYILHYRHFVNTMVVNSVLSMQKGADVRNTPAHLCKLNIMCPLDANHRTLYHH